MRARLCVRLCVCVFSRSCTPAWPLRMQWRPSPLPKFTSSTSFASLSVRARACVCVTLTVRGRAGEAQRARATFTNESERRNSRRWRRRSRSFKNCGHREPRDKKTKNTHGRLSGSAKPSRWAPLSHELSKQASARVHPRSRSLGSLGGFCPSSHSICSSGSFAAEAAPKDAATGPKRYTGPDCRGPRLGACARRVGGEWRGGRKIIDPGPLGYFL